MAWPLTGSALTKYNRLLSDLRQYGDFIFVGAPDDITWLQETIVAASDGQLRPPLDDVANRSHYWMLRTIAFFAEQVVVTPCPECPPAVPCPPLTGIDWGPDNTTLDVTVSGVLDFFSLTSVTSIILRSLETVTGGYISVTGSSVTESFSAPELISVEQGMDFSSNPMLSNVDLPVFVPTNVTSLLFGGNALTDVSVNHILARAVANVAYVNGTIELSGGTNAAPTGQGIADKATLIGRGVTVNTN